MSLIAHERMYDVFQEGQNVYNLGPMVYSQK